MGGTVLSAVPAPGGRARMSGAGRFFFDRGPALRPVQELAYTVYLEPISSANLFLIPVPRHVTGRFRELEVDANEAVLVRRAELRRPALRRRLQPDNTRPEAPANRAHRVSGADRAPPA